MARLLPGETTNGHGAITGSPIFGSPANGQAAADWVRQNLPQWAPYMNDPELGPLLQSAYVNGWDGNQFQMRIMGTNFYKNIVNGQTSYNGKSAAQQAQDAGNMQATINAIGMSMGLTGLGGLGGMAAKNGWNADQIRQYLAGRVNMDTAHQAGLVSAAFQQAKNIAGDYYVRVDDNTALGFARRVAAGEMSTQDLQGWAQQQAASKYPYLKDIIDKGTTVRQYFAPMQAEMARLLDKTPEQVDLMNNDTYSKVTQTVDPATGAQRAMTVGEAQDYVRGLDEWKTTKNAKSQAALAVTAIAHTMGAM